MTFVKICSVRAVEHAVWAREAGADADWHDLRRRAAAHRHQGRSGGETRTRSDESRSWNRAQKPPNANAVRPGQPLLVGVFARQSVDEIERVLDRVDLDLVQLSGGEHPALVGRIRRAVVRAVHVAEGMDAAAVLREIDRAPNTMTMLDAMSKQGGGTGQRIDWSLAAEVAALRPLLLAGGLNPENVGEAVRSVRPWAVDVSSGVSKPTACQGSRENPRVYRSGEGWG